MEHTLPVLTKYLYWKDKREFLLAEDTYDEWVLFAVERGSFRYRFGGSQGVAAARDWVVCPPGRRFEREAIEPLDFHFIGFAYPDEAHGSDRAAEDDSGRPQGCFRFPVRERALEDYAMLRRDDWPDPAVGELCRRHAFRDLWLMLPELGAAGLRGDPSPDPDVRRAADRLQASVEAPIPLKRLAAELGWTPVQLTRRFQAAYRVTPQQYVTSLRMRRACALLAETDWTLERIAERCGYENGFYLSRVFSRCMGKSPSQYRKEHRM